MILCLNPDKQQELIETFISSGPADVASWLFECYKNNLQTMIDKINPIITLAYKRGVISAIRFGILTGDVYTLYKQYPKKGLNYLNLLMRNTDVKTAHEYRRCIFLDIDAGIEKLGEMRGGWNDFGELMLSNPQALEPDSQAYSILILCKTSRSLSLCCICGVINIK